MNEKINDKPIEMPARGRPRKKEAGLDQFGNEYEVQKSMYGRNNFPQFVGSNSILDYIEGSPEKEGGIRNMYPFSSYDEEMISPKEVQYKGGSGSMNVGDGNLGNVGSGNSYNGSFGTSSPNSLNNSYGSNSYGSNSLSNNPLGSNFPSTYNTPYPLNGLYSRQDDFPFGLEQKRACLKDPSFFSPRQQYYSSFTSENQMPLSHFRTTLKEIGTSSPSPTQQHNFITPHSFIGSNPWYSRKKRKSNPLLWQDSPQNIIHPSKYSSLDYIQGVDSSHPKRDSNNSILPLFLSSSKEMTDEYKEVVGNFKHKISELDFTNVTVQQLKIFMREFGLNHTGKKNELIDRLKSTIHKIDNRATAPKEVKKKPEPKETDEYGFYFF